MVSSHINKDKRTDGEIIRNSVLRHKKIFFQMYKDEFNAKLVNIKYCSQWRFVVDIDIIDDKICSTSKFY